MAQEEHNITSMGTDPLVELCGGGCMLTLFSFCDHVLRNGARPMLQLVLEIVTHQPIHHKRQRRTYNWLQIPPLLTWYVTMMCFC